MQKFWPAFVVSVLSGALTIAVFPRIGWGWLAFFCLVPLFLLVPSNGPRRLFILFFLGGIVFHLGNLYWITHVIQHYSHLGMLLSIGVVILLCITLSLLWAFVGWLLGKLTAARSYDWAMLLVPFLWVAQEYVRNKLQFPWCLLGYSQYENLRFAQVASALGVYGLSLILVAVNASIAHFLITRKKYYVMSTIIIVLISIFYGHFRISRAPVAGEKLAIGIVQGNIPQDVKINYEFAEEVNQLHIGLTERLLESQKLDLVLWSESSTLYPLKVEGKWSDDVRALAIRTKTPLLIGSDSYIGEKVYNSAFLINEAGVIEEADYSKIYLVPFGEFVPLKNLFFFAGKVVPEISDFSPGEKYTVFRLNGNPFAVHICFEVIFPQLSRAFVKNGASVLVTITNDAWFGHTCAPYQHFAQAVMRSIETRRYLVRAANTGISGFVDPYGRVLQKTKIFTEATISGEVQALAEQTFYVKHGDIVVYIALIISLGSLPFFLGKASRERKL